MPTLTRDLRKLLENTVKDARRAAEAGAAKALNRLRVGEAEAPKLTSEQELRRRLREHGRQLGDQRDERRGTQTIVHLKAEYAYEHWHRMLFARFLAETDLLIEPETGVAISLPECQELARERGEDWLELASTFAERMLPQIFRKGDPLLDVALPPETRSGLEDLLKKLPRDVFLADDSLGWVYQFWQAEKKDEVNAAEKKIGAEELPAVTQLFTEDYMVLFLLHNTLGAWWAGKILAQHPTIATSAQTEDEVRAACSVGDVVWTHLRFTGGQGTPWEPAAGILDSWPRSAKEIRLLDPCMGSGHFLVFALPILVAVRMAEEGLSRDGAIEAVLRENLFGLEIDPRCTQIAAFNLALAAWKRGGYQTLPPLHLACSGLGINARLDTWLKLAGTNHRLRGGMDRLYQLFQQAPVVGSLINPQALVTDLLVAEFHDLKPLLEQALADETDESMHEFAVTARGLAEAAEILASKFTLVATNVPYLGRTRQANTLMEYCDRHYSDAKADLATCFIQRLISLTEKGGTAAFVAKQEWLFLGKYSAVRRRTLDEELWIFAARLGPHAFETITGERVNVSLHAITSLTPDEEHRFFSLDVSDEKTPAAKATAILERAPDKLSQSAQLRNPDSRVTTESAPRSGPTLGSIVDSYQGIVTGDLERFRLCFWEVPALGSAWVPFRTTVSRTGTQDGSYSILRWEQGTGQLHRYAAETRHQLHDMHESGNRAWGHRGVALNRMSGLQATVYSGEHFDNNVAVLIPQDDSSLVALLAFCSSPNFPEEVRKLDRTLKVTNRTLVKVPFNLTHWQRVGAETYPNGLPPTDSEDPTEWFFAGHPRGTVQSLQTAVARLVGYRWPRQTGSNFADCPARVDPDDLVRHADSDGIVCLSPLKGEPPGAVRLNALLADAFGSDWCAAKLGSLLSEVGFGNKSLDDWLRDAFFAQHCDLFHQRPFVWHIWDGRRDGFHALVNYHKLVGANGEGRRLLDKLIYTYLGDWIDRQREDQRKSVEGADARLAAAEHLRKQVEDIIIGEPDFDIFVRWRPLHQQAIGWEPEFNDGIRINIRPFMMAKPLGARAANTCILRATPKLSWGKDRGNEPPRDCEDFPWFWGWDEETVDFGGGKHFDGNRWNDLHYTSAFKRTARERHAAKTAGGKR